MNYTGITIQPYHPEDNFDKETLTKRLEDIFYLPVKWLPPAELPQIAYNPARNQFLGDYFLRELVNVKDNKEIALGIVSVDLYEPELNFVFGVASAVTKTAVISTYRLHNTFYGLPENKQIFIDRITKEAVHEIGHTLGLGHCPDPECVMHFSNSIVDTDRKSYLFCSSCYQKVQAAIGL